MSRCVALTLSGAPCRNNAMRGAERCSIHLGVARHHDHLTSEVADRIVTMLRAGNYVETSAVAAGVSRPTLYGWWARGKAEGTGRFAEFRERCVQARSEGEARNVALIATAAQTNWQAAAWLLERSYPDRWGRTPIRVREQTTEAPPASEPAPPEPDPFAELDELAEARRRRLA